MPHAAINGQQIYFEDSGGDGAPVVLAHGFLMDHEMFAPQVAALTAAGYRTITWDERGFGLTEFDGQPFTYWDSARNERKPPWLIPPTIADSRPRWSSSPRQSAAESQ